jgi:hypothetical protein
MPDWSASAESEAGCDFNAVVEFAGFVPPAIIDINAVVLAQGLGVGHFVDMPPLRG